MRFSKFEFKNFRGIASTSLDLSKVPKNAVNVLVGLNESGKTTILEAINHFRSNPDLKRKDPNPGEKSDADYQAMIPIGERALFNGSISLKSTISIESNDVARIDEFLKSKHGFSEVKYDKDFYIDYKVTFEGSKRKVVNNAWSLHFYGRKRKGKTPFKKLDGEDWLAAVNFVATLLPKVMYFPASLLEFPDRIYLEENVEVDEETKITQSSKDSFYYQVIEDILHAIDAKFDIEKHILTRIKSGTESDRQNLDALIQKVENHLNRTVLGEWKKTLGATLGGKRFRFQVHLNEERLAYAEIKLFDGNSLFSLNERSAGFRWFFAFIMLVKYRVHRNDRVLFLFDEPAGNLHPRAQAALLDSFTELSKTHQFLYTTHSHYLVNPLWLESTFIVKNDAIEAEGNSIDVDPKASNITITPYRAFVGSHPEQYFYYKPVMDALEYSPARISPENCSVFIEGKTDFYCLEYFKQVYFPEKSSITLFPGGGSGSLDPLISLMSGWGKEFLILLDGDASGEKEKTRYIEKFESLVDSRITTISELLGVTGKIRIENIFAEVDLDLIRTTLFPTEKTLSKKLLHKGIQELLATKRKLSFSKKTTQSFEKLIDSLAASYMLLTL